MNVRFLARDADAPRSVTGFAATILKSRLNFRPGMSTRQFDDHDLVFVGLEMFMETGRDNSDNPALLRLANRSVADSKMALALLSDRRSNCHE